MALIRPLCLFLLLCMIAISSWPTSSVAKIASKDDSSYLIGTGIADMTAQIAEVGFMGYAVPNQRGSGLHIRQRSRAFIIGHPTDIANRIVYVSIDFCMGFHMMKQFVIEKLQQQFGPTLYTHDNVIISGTHTHSTPGGMGGTVLVDITTFGFSKENFNAGVEGIYNSIVKAHNNAQLGTIKVNKGELLDASINRSPASYLLDPDRENYSYDTDKDMTVLRFESTSGVELGMVSFFAVHATSMNNTNTLVSGDNKGLASQLFEAVKNPHTLPGKGSFVAAFGQSNEGDVSPNTRGPKCPDGSDCDFVHSTCGGKTEGCIASGPGNNMEESTWIIANKQYEKASELYDSAKQFIHGPIDWRHTYVDMQSINVSSQYTGTGNNERTCVPALGYSFAGGTTDGPGDFDFTQGTTSPNPFWAFVSQFVAKPTQDQINCQAPKPILLDVGLTKPIEWSAYILPHQIIRVGSLWIIAVPVEMTSMSGRRLRNQVQQQLIQAGVWNDDSYIVIAGLSNSYSHYLATYEEYQLQRYEGASTLYGPHTEAAYRQIYTDIIQSLIRNQSLPSGPTPADMRNRTISFLPGVVYDAVPEGKQYGNVETQPKQAYKIGETVSAVFWCASPRNDLFTEKTFLDIEYLDLAASEWRVIADDSLWETKYRWQRYQVDKSLCTIEWTIPIGSPSGQYRINTYGVHKNLLGEKTPFTGQTNTFTVSL